MALPLRVASSWAENRALGQGRLLVCARRRKGRGWGGEDPISPPCSRPLGRAPQMGLGEEAGSAPGALRLHQLCGPTRARGLRGSPVPVWFSGRRARTQRSGEKRRLPGGPEPTRPRHCALTTPPRQRLLEAAASPARLGLRPRRPVSRGSASLPSLRPARR